MEHWQGRCAVVTGGSGGIGSAVCKKLAERGLTVVNLDVNGPDCAQDKAVHFRKCDLSKLDQIKAAFQWVEENGGGVDLMVNAAGLVSPGHFTNLADNSVSDEDIQAQLNVNLYATIFCSRLAVDSMKRRGVDGHIVNINSVAGHSTPKADDFNVYSATKHGVTEFTATLRNELAHLCSKIKITSVSPGLVQTKLATSRIKDFSSIPALQPEDVADQILHVLSAPPHVNISEITIQPVGEILL